MSVAPRPKDIPPEVWSQLPLDIQLEFQCNNNTDKNKASHKEEAKGRKRQNEHSQASSIKRWFAVDTIQSKEALSSDDFNLTNGSSQTSIISTFTQKSICNYREGFDDDIDPFVDDQFPACADSIDGRRISGSHTGPEFAGRSKPTDQLCKCNMKCRLRQVYKDGQNQGRHFISCATRKCDFFAWADYAQHDDRVSKLVWKRFDRKDGWKLVSKGGYSPDHILQGGVGDCWFLSAVAVLAERRDLIEKVIPDSELHPSGKVNFKLFIDGHWKDVIVDTYLPCRPPASSSSTTGKKESVRASGKATVEQSLAYSRTSQDDLWVPLLEKAYAKAHGSYHAISGGHVHEALLDLTGAPCEIIDFCDDYFDSEETWVRLLSFHEAGFPMGCATAVSGEGIVGGHAYSILDVRELSGITLGEQTQLEDFFRKTNKYLAQDDVVDGPEVLDGDDEILFIGDNDDDVVVIDKSSASMTSTKKRPHYPTSASAAAKTTELLTENGSLRVLRIRNPWGKKEWQGQFGSGSEVWTSKLEQLLDKGKKNDGTFWITYHDFLRRYTCVDVCKAHRGDWHAESYDVWTKPGHLSCQGYYIMTVLEPTWMYLTLIQKTKRGRNFSQEDRQYWYSNLSLVILRIEEDSAEHSSERSFQQSSATSVLHLRNGETFVVGEVVGARFCHPRRDTPPIELHLASGRYAVVPLHIPDNCPVQGTRDLAKLFSVSTGEHSSSLPSSSANPASRPATQKPDKFVVRVFSSNAVIMEAVEDLGLQSVAAPAGGLQPKTGGTYSAAAATTAAMATTASEAAEAAPLSDLQQKQANIPTKPTITIPQSAAAVALRKALVPVNYSSAKITGLHSKRIVCLDVNDLPQAAATTTSMDRATYPPYPACTTTACAVDNNVSTGKSRTVNETIVLDESSNDVVREPPPVSQLPSTQRAENTVNAEVVDLCGDDDPSYDTDPPPLFINDRSKLITDIQGADTLDDRGLNTMSSSPGSGRFSLEIREGNEITFLLAFNRSNYGLHACLGVLSCNLNIVTPCKVSIQSPEKTTTTSYQRNIRDDGKNRPSSSSQSSAADTNPHSPQHSEHLIVFSIPANSHRLIAVLTEKQLRQRVTEEFLYKSLVEPIGELSLGGSVFSLCRVDVRRAAATTSTATATTVGSGGLIQRGIDWRFFDSIKQL